MTLFWLAAAWLFTIALFFALIPLARRIGYVDQPGGRKQHDNPIPPIGGLVILPIFTGLLLTFSLMDHGMAVLLTGVVVLFAMGAYDDLHQVNAWVKFTVQCLVAFFVVVYGGIEARQLGNLFGLGDVGLNVLTVPFSIAALVLFMNALNMMDGMDGLAGGMAAVILGWLTFAAYQAGQGTQAVQIACLLAPLLGFLTLNMRHPFVKKAKVFLGDAGALCLALIIGWFAIDLSQAPGRALWPVGVIWLLAIPVMDTLTLFFLRTRRGRHPFSPDRNHLHHRIYDKGIKVRWTTPFLLLGAAACGSLGVQGPAIGIPQFVLLVLWVAMLAGYITYSLRPGKDRQFIA